MSDNSNTQGISDRPQKKWVFRISILILTLAVIFGFFFGVFKFFQNLGIGNVFTLAYDFIAAPPGLVASENGRTNILVMGKAGGSHEGPDLTDTMLLVSVSKNSPGITTVSIPRDLWIPEIRAKINSAYYWGNQTTAYFGNSTPNGISFAKNITQKVVGDKIQYGVVIDFSAFKDIVDALGGIRVDVSTGFTDKLYPIAGRENDLCGGDPKLSCRYQTVTFSSGSQLMDGDTALIFVRSRHAEGPEGTDTARQERQQKVINAIKNKIMDPKVLISPKVDLALLNVLKKYVQTDIDGPTAAVLGRMVLKGDKNIKQYLIPEDLLANPPISKTYDQLYVFIPAAGNGNWENINKWFNEVLNKN